MDSSNSHDHARSTSNDQLEQTEIISNMDSKLMEAAAKGHISSFDGYVDRLNLLLTPSKNTILHICISARTISENSMSKLIYSVAKDHIFKFRFLAYFCPDHVFLTANTILHICISARTKSANSINFINQILRNCPSLSDQANATGEIPLHFAARYGHEDIVKVLIENAKAQHEDLERGVAAAREMLRKMNTEKDTALHEAVKNNHLEVVRILIKEDADFCYLPNDAGESPVYLAAERGYGDIVVEILDNCTIIAYDGPNGRTALHEAAINNGAEMIRRLLEKNESLVRKTDQRGWTPLHHAAYFGHLSIVKQLLEADKSTAYIGDKDGKKTPLHLAAGLGDSHVKVMKSILSYCPDCCELVDDRGRNVFHFALESYGITALSVLLQNPFTSNLINQKDNEGNTPLHLLASLRFYCYSLIWHPLVDKKAMNKENLTALDIVFDTTDSCRLNSSRLHTWKSLVRAGCKKSTRNKICPEENAKKFEARIEGMYLELKKAKEAHLIVATLIATVTFAAGVTMPGGYNSEKGKDIGTALLSKKTAFKVFVVSDACAFVVSTTVVLMHFLLAVQPNKIKFFQLFKSASSLIGISTICMVLAFATSMYAVLPDSSELRDFAWIISGCFFVLLFFIDKYSSPFYLIDYDPKTQAGTSYESKRDG